MKKTNKLLAALLAVITVLALFPTAAFAADVEDIQPAGKNGKISWFISQGILCIYGEDDITDFYINADDVSTTAPWSARREEVQKIVIESGVKSIGRSSFRAFVNLTAVYLPKSVKSVGPSAFAGCTALKTVYFENLKTDTGWELYMDEDNDSFGNADFQFGVTFTANLTYTVKFNANGGKGTMNTETVQRDNSYTLPANKFTKSCCTFTGWNTKADGSGTAYKNKAAVINIAKAGKTATLYAQWNLESGCYTIKYVLNGGNNSTGNPAAYSASGSDIKLKNPTRSGYTFAGWYKTADFSGSKVTTLAAATKKNVTLYAKWVKTYQIQFVANGGTGTMANAKCTVNVARTLPANKFTRACYSFNGWNTAKNGSGTAYKNKATVKNLSKTQGAVVKLYAQWKLKTGCCTVKYVLNGGKNNAANPEAYSAKGSDITLKKPTRTGYTFAGWYKTADFTGGKVTKITASAKKNVKLYAKWTANKYTVKFAANGGTGAMAAKTYVYAKTYTLPANAFKKSGAYVFNGWNTKADGSGKAYANKAKVKNLSAKNGATVTLYAQWKLNVTDAAELDNVCSILRRTCEPLYMKLHGNNVSSKQDANGLTIWSVSTRANGTWEYVYANQPGAWDTLGATYCLYNAPLITMASSNSAASDYRSALLNGTYDFANDPGDVYIAWSMYTSDTTKADFQKMINNKISDEVFDSVIAKYNGRTVSSYGGACVIVYGKDTNGRLIGKYAGSVYYNNVSNAAECYFVNINPKNTDDYGKATSKTLIY